MSCVYPVVSELVYFNSETYTVQTISHAYDYIDPINFQMVTEVVKFWTVHH